MDLRYLRHFLAVADELHFGRAAARLNMAQAPLSQSIKRLEAHLGTQLFDRSPQSGTRLTEAGRRFRPAAERAVREFDTAIAQARRDGAPAPEPVRVGFVTLGLSDRLPHAIRTLEGLYPEISVRLEEGATRPMLDAIASGKLQMALVHPVHDTPPGVILTPVRRDRVVAALPIQHPLATRRSVSLRELAAEPLIFFPRGISPDLHDGLLLAFHALGLRPRIHQEARSTPTMLLLVAAGLGYALVAEGARQMPLTNVRYLPVTDLPSDLRWGLDLATLETMDSGVAGRLVELLHASG